MTLDEIKKAIDDGLEVKWSSDIYRVKKYDNTKELYLICIENNRVWGLTRDGKFINEETEDKFYI